MQLAIKPKEGVVPFPLNSHLKPWPGTFASQYEVQVKVLLHNGPVPLKATLSGVVILSSGLGLALGFNTSKK